MSETKKPSKQQIMSSIDSFNNLNKDNQMEAFQGSAGYAKTDDQRIKEGSENSRRQIVADIEAGKDLGEDLLGDGLGRIQDDSDVNLAKDTLRSRSEEGLSTTEVNAMRDQGLGAIQGAEQTQSRALSASLARSGVRGGAAGQAQVELAAQGLQNRRQLETDLILSDEQVKREAESSFANFSTQLAEFDLSQAAKEKNIVLQSALATAQLGSAERGAILNQIAQENAAEISSDEGGTVLCTAMYHHGLISKSVWEVDVLAGMMFVRSKKTRKAFLAYNRICKPLAKFCKNNKWAALAISPIIIPISKHFSDNNIIGRVLFKTAKYIFTKISKRGNK